jgi:hypothetical protein
MYRTYKLNTNTETGSCCTVDRSCCVSKEQYRHKGRDSALILCSSIFKDFWLLIRIPKLRMMHSVKKTKSRMTNSAVPVHNMANIR